FPVEAGAAFQFFAFAFPFPAIPTLPDSFPFRFRSEFDSGGQLERPLPFGVFTTLTDSLGDS
ncbi:hypothetical protein, partial [Streptomyces sp. Root1319]|uniref:hypothetical protein n=1 Tax=Streptomyces sp. Root1319 TaxID=1736454 RepID=UPI001A7EB7AC